MVFEYALVSCILKHVLRLLLALTPVFCTAQDQSTFVSPQYGCSLRYPSSLASIGTDKPALYLDYNQPFTRDGETLVIVVSLRTDIPRYKGTDLSAAFVMVKVNPMVTKAECHIPSGANEGPVTNTVIDGHRFESMQADDAAMMKNFTGTYSFGFVQGACYQVSKVIYRAGFGAVDGMRQVDDKSVRAQLNTIEKSIHFVRPGKRPGH